MENQTFLDNIFEELRLKRLQQGQVTPQIQFGDVYQDYKTIHIQDIQEDTIIEDQQQIDGRNIWNKTKQLNLLYYDESCPLNVIDDNGFFRTFYLAYIRHGDLKITPDDVWSAIILYLSNYIIKNSQQLRKAFVNHQGKKNLEVITSQQIKQTEWSQFFEKIIDQISKNSVKQNSDRIKCDFIFTNRFFTNFSTAIIMNSFQHYFKYIRRIKGCGIKNIHMGGLLQDWEYLLNKLDSLSKFNVNGEMYSYIRRLKPVIEQFIETYKGRPHLQFWNNLYQERKNPKSGSYQPKGFIDGWILRFFTLQDQLTNNQKLNIEQIKVPITIINEITKTEKVVQLVGGCCGVSITDGLVYRPHFSMAIIDSDTKI